MIKKFDPVEALQFYADNDLCEVISEKAQNHFAQNDVKKDVVEPEKNSATQFFTKPVFSTNEAISNLAKKSRRAPSSAGSST